MEHLSVSIREEQPPLDPELLQLDTSHLNVVQPRKRLHHQDDEDDVEDEYAQQLMMLRQQTQQLQHEIQLHDLRACDPEALDLDVGDDVRRAVDALEQEYGRKPPSRISPKRKKMILLLTLLNMALKNRMEAAEKFVTEMATLLTPREVIPRAPRSIPLGWFARKYEGPRDEFFSCFRMYQEGFDEIFRAVRPHLPQRRSCEVPFREIVAANFYHLMFGATMREVEDLFGVSAAYLTRLQAFVYRAIIQGVGQLEQGRMGMPESPEEAFQEASRWRTGTASDDHRFEFLDRCCGAIGHFLIPAVVREQGKAFDADRWRHDRGFTCTNVIAIVRHDRTFCNAWIGAEGSIPDIQILDWSGAEASIPDGFFCLYENPSVLTSKLLTPFPDVRFHLSDFAANQPEYSKSLFNYYHALQRASVTELAIGLLKGRFACLRYGMLGNLESLILKVRACLVLHNYIQRTYGDEDHILAVAKRAREEMAGGLETGEAINLSECFPRLTIPRIANPSVAMWRERLAEQCFQQSAGHLNCFSNDVDHASLQAARDMNEYRIRPPYSGKSAELNRANIREKRGALRQSDL